MTLTLWLFGREVLTIRAGHDEQAVESAGAFGFAGGELSEGR